MVRRLWLAAATFGLLALTGMSAQAALNAMSRHPGIAGAAHVLARGYEADDHFPGAALLYAEPATAAPAAGVTGTAALPALPIPAAAAEIVTLSDAGLSPARPFSTKGTSAIDRERALECLASAIYYEAGSEPLVGQEAVAQVVLNRVRHPAFPATVCGVVYQGSERTVCQFSFACDGALRRIPSSLGWARATRVAAAALAGYVYAPVGLATHYHTYAVTPAWNRTLVMTDMIGAHLFHRWKGYWGTAAAFGQVYRGGEPAPGPHGTSPSSELQPLILAANVSAIPTPPSAVRQAYAESGAPVRQPLSAGTANLPAAAEVLDKWKDSGTLRQQ